MDHKQYCNLSRKTTIEPIYEKYRAQIDAIVEAMDKNYKKSAIIIAWLYGGSSERWRKVLPNKKSQTMPKDVKEFLKKFKAK